jgi:hypothetical protein
MTQYEDDIAAGQVPKTAADFLALATQIVGERELTHGEIVRGQSKIATLWQAYLSIRRYPSAHLSAEDATALMLLLKLARMHSGEKNIDNDLDLIGYAAKLAEVRNR